MIFFFYFYKLCIKRKKNLFYNMMKLSINLDESDNIIKSNDLIKIGIVSVLLILSKLCYG